MLDALFTKIASLFTPEIYNKILGYSIELCGAVIILTIGWIVAARAYQGVLLALAKIPHVDKTFEPLIAGSIRYLILTITIIATLGQFGVPTASIIALLGAIGFAIGLALQGTLSNVAAGVLLLVLRPFRVKDIIEVNHVVGFVEEINLFATSLKAPDNTYVSIPNNILLSTTIRNYTRYSQRCVELLIRTDSQANPNLILTSITDIFTQESRILKDPPPKAFIENLESGGLLFKVKAWTKTEDHDEVKAGLYKIIKLTLDENNITLYSPYHSS